MLNSTTDETIIHSQLNDCFYDYFSAILTFDNDVIYNTIKTINNKTKNITLYESFYVITLCGNHKRKRF